MVQFTALTRDERVNALLGWVLSGSVALAAVESLLRGAVLWAALTVVVLAVALVPPAATGRWRVMVPWPVVGLAAVAALLRAVGRSPELAGYLAVATFALLAVVELDAFTPVRMSRAFAVGFAALTTLAAQGCWIVGQYYSDRWLGTAFLRSQRELQWDIVLVTGVSVAVAAAFQWYFARTGHVGSHRRPQVRGDDAG
ncbi:hypothetical protein [Haloarcula onubensis]|uniref:Uncharacterized protein n=1 Tax=Haloarcula onubensis TaxID=2950539 RepID=A0ABU2FQ86_9EURY|nr:hypothetical protein [Halomicroarcula sp. S3CR25-11]MDS0282923.1 hypothetical protein [Halomicroarcula sp. S3CR25-11]